MKKLTLLAAVPFVIACAAETTAVVDTVTETVSETATAVASEVTMADAPDLSTLPAGTYVDEDGHAYIQFSYDHQGYSKPILRWSAFDATVNYDPSNPENSTLRVVIPADSIDSMVPAFDNHLKSADFFDVENY
ncbi:MAG: YceI family protein, partial [Pseudomonadota bacterium]